jgi:hypothetical protein
MFLPSSNDRIPRLGCQLFNTVRICQTVDILLVTTGLPNSAFSRTMREIANTAAQEFNNPNNRGLTIERKAAYSRFQSFAEK